MTETRFDEGCGNKNSSSIKRTQVDISIDGCKGESTVKDKTCMSRSTVGGYRQGFVIRVNLMLYTGYPTINIVICFCLPTQVGFRR